MTADGNGDGARVVPTGDIDLAATLGSVAWLPRDPTTRLSPGRFERATLTPEGPETVVGFEPSEQPLRDLWRRHGRRRIPATGTLWHDLACTVVQQRISRLDAADQWHRLVSTHGTPAPGVDGLLVPPTPQVVGRLTAADLHRLGIERRRGATLAMAAPAVLRLQSRTDEAWPAVAAPWARSVASVPGPSAAWTLGCLAALTWGDRDAVIVGDSGVTGTTSAAADLGCRRPELSEVGASVRDVRKADREPVEGEPLPWLPEDVAPGCSETELVADIWAADAREARDAALRAVSVAALARRRRREHDRDRGRRGGPGLDSRMRESEFLADVSEDFVSELALIRCCSELEAERLTIESLLLTTKLRGTWSALYEGRIDLRRMRALVELLGPARPDVVTAIERRVLPRAGALTVAQLRDRVRRALAQLDAAALAARHRAAAARADVVSQPIGDGMARLTIDLPVWKSVACRNAIAQLADLQRAGGDQRPIGVIRCEVAADLILRPWDTSRPPVTAEVVVHAPLAALRPADPATSQPPTEVGGQVVTAAQCRELLEELDRLGYGNAPAGGCVRVAIGDPVTGRLVAVATRSELRRGAGRSRRRRARRSGAVVLPDGPGVGPPPGTTGYRATAQQRRFVRTRDLHCRMPGCRRRAGRCDLDHVVAHGEGGPTACWNLCCLCRRHHRIKTFARGWNFQLLDDGRLIVRTPSGLSRVSRPPGWCADPEPDPPWLEEQAPPDPLRC